MHILIIPSWYPETPDGNDGIFFRQQAQALQRSGLKIGVIAPIFRSLRARADTIFSTNYGLYQYIEENVPTFAYRSMYFFPRVPYVDRFRWVRAGKKLFKAYVAKYGKPDVIHAHSMNNAGILAQIIHEETGIPYVLTEHSSTYARNLIPNWQRPAMQKAAEQCSARIAVSKDFCALLQKEYQGLNWKYIPNILSEKFNASIDLENKPNNQYFTFCSVAHLNQNKGFDILLPAFAEALKAYPFLKLKIGGTGAQEVKLKKLANSLNLHDSVQFLGGLKNEQVLKLMYQSDAFVLASRVETFGVVFIEALSQGLPVIATYCGGPQSIVNQQNGLLVPVEDIKALANAFIQLYETRQQFNPHKLRQQCLAEFGESAITTKLKAEYQNILQS